MGKLEAENPQILASYEGLVFTTSARLVRSERVEMELEDIQQVLRLKVWRALVSFDIAKCRTTRDKYVFMCVRDQAKDILKKKVRGELLIEDLADTHGGVDEGATLDRFQARYLVATPDEIYGEIEDEVFVPNTLSGLERAVVVLLYRDYKQTEIAVRLELDRREVEKLVQSIRKKMEDWRPGVAAPALERVAA